MIPLYLPIVIGAIASAFSAAWVRIYPYNSPTTAVAVVPKVEPWIETGWPVEQNEFWRIRVCHAHWQLLQNHPYSTPKPLHASLNLDATSEPFHPPSLSSSPGDMWHGRVLKAVLKAVAKETGKDLAWAASRLSVQAEGAFQSGPGLGPEAERMFLLFEIGSILADDDIRGHYAKWFVPELTTRKTFALGEEGRRKSRIKALERLCA
ncbi:hypothetical protein N0V84_012448 [Fusarium piperis]|uniref:Uncharacterized protein n=1 Tax=Fusarium piperis TaxID=1435070 RepID=A0A9W8W3K0_9HYPO|nr:hypothetical protein N0V84_012448 [Fusarium piperis]